MNNDQKQYLNLLNKKMSNKFNITKEYANDIINKSGFIKLLE